MGLKYFSNYFQNTYRYRTYRIFSLTFEFNLFKHDNLSFTR